jgi:UDP-glucose 4-epimerase
VMRELSRGGRTVRALVAPRLTVDPGASAADLVGQLRNGAHSETIAALSHSLRGVRVVVNAAGLATPGAQNSPELMGGNGMLPGIIALAAADAGVRRILHISSAAVQDRRDPLDESSEVAPASPYAKSKATGEAVLALLRQIAATDTLELNMVVLRATSVHGPDRQTTASLIRLARSRWSSVAGDGTRATPIVRGTELAETVRFIGEIQGFVPAVVLQPWSGRTTGVVLRDLGQREPKHLPVAACRLLLALGYELSRFAGGRGRSRLRQLEVLWMGQAQTSGWLEANGMRVGTSQHSLLSQDSEANK